MQMKMLLLTFVGGGIGSVLRLFLSRWLNEGAAFPWGTLSANVVACLMLGVVVTAVDAQQLSLEYRWLLAVGFCGGLSTFSTFSYELLSLNAGYQHLFTAVAYAMLSLVLGLGALVLGSRIPTLLG